MSLCDLHIFNFLECLNVFNDDTDDQLEDEVNTNSPAEKEETNSCTFPIVHKSQEVAGNSLSHINACHLPIIYQSPSVAAAGHRASHINTEVKGSNSRSWTASVQLQKYTTVGLVRFVYLPMI